MTRRGASRSRPEISRGKGCQHARGPEARDRVALAKSELSECPANVERSGTKRPGQSGGRADVGHREAY